MSPQSDMAHYNDEQDDDSNSSMFESNVSTSSTISFVLQYAFGP
jgi:hypothetical protein